MLTYPHRLFNSSDRQKKEVFNDAIHAEVSLYLLSQRTYIATRRKTFTVLPGIHTVSSGIYYCARDKCV